MHDPAATVAGLRRAIFLLLVFGLAGMLAELLVSGHTEDAWQLVPVVLLGLGILLAAGLALWRRRGLVVTFQVLSLLAAGSGIAGSYLHYRAKAEFALERDPTLRGTALFRQALKGTNPPLLAPGAMIALGLLGLTWTYRKRDDA